jgi:hypothetical protein
VAWNPEGKGHLYKLFSMEYMTGTMKFKPIRTYRRKNARADCTPTQLASAQEPNYIFR